jgi:hypothetical protein
MNSVTHIRVRKYNTEYAADTTWLGEYAADARNNSPREKANQRIDLICFGIRIGCAETRRLIARKAISESHPT